MSMIEICMGFRAAAPSPHSVHSHAPAARRVLIIPLELEI